MKGCELCDGVARMYCESDQASLCWDCDEKVHCANFLVAKHYRCLLCKICQSSTPWKASGSKLGPTVSICESCFSLYDGKGEINEDRQESFAGNEQEDDSSEGDSSDDDEEEGEKEDGENQVVPWSVSPPSPPAASSSSSEGEISIRFSCGGTAVLKRVRENNIGFDSDDEIGFSSSHIGYGRLNNDEGNSMASIRGLKQARTGEVEEDNDDQPNNHDGQAESRSTAIIDSLKRLQSEMVINRESADETIVGICRLSRDSHSH